MNKKIALISALAICAGILSGCSGSTDSESGSTSAESTSGTTSAPVTSATDSIASQAEESSTPSEAEQTTASESAPPQEEEPAEKVEVVSHVNYMLEPSTTAPIGVGYNNIVCYLPDTMEYVGTAWVDNNFQVGILNHDFTVKDEVPTNGMTFADYGYPVFGYKDINDNKKLWINGNEFDVEKQKFEIVDNIVICSEEYYTLEGEKLDIPYHGPFYDGICMFTEDGKTLGMDKSGNITDYTDKVKAIADQGHEITAMVDGKYYVADDMVWFDLDCNEIGSFGKPVMGSDGKYVVDGIAYTEIKNDYRNDSFIVDLSTGKTLFESDRLKYNRGSDYAAVNPKDFGADTNDPLSYIVKKDGSFPSFYSISDFYDGIALASAEDGVYFVNADFDIVSDKICEKGYMRQVTKYIGGGLFSCIMDGTDEYAEGTVPAFYVVNPMLG